MPSSTFLANAFLEVPLAVALFAIGAKIHQRSRLEQRPALAWFAAFWIGIGAYAFVEAGWALAYLAGAQALAVGLFVLHVKIVGMVVAFAGLVAYLLSIHGSDKRVISVFLGAYGVILAIVETYYSWRAPVAQEPGVWGMRLVYAVNATQPWWTIVLLILLLPPFVATIAYLLLLRHARERDVRYRIALTSASLLLFFLPMFVGWRAGGFPWWGAVEKSLTLLMTAGISLALWPPPPVARWLSAEKAPSGPDALLERARLLV